MALLGHVSAEMSLCYGRLFDATVKAEYERALTRCQTAPRHASLSSAWRACTASDHRRDSKQAPAVKARLVGSFCIRAQAQGPVCLRQHLPAPLQFPHRCRLPAALAAQRADAETLARDAEARGWISDADRNRASSNTSTRTSDRHKPDDTYRRPSPPRRRRLRGTHPHRPARHLRRRRRPRQTRPRHLLPQLRTTRPRRGTPHPRPRGRTCPDSPAKSVTSASPSKPSQRQCDATTTNSVDSTNPNCLVASQRRPHDHTPISS